VRRSWRIMSALALMLAAGSMLLSAWLYTTIQDEREKAVRENCEATNQRHDATITQLDRLIVRLPPGPRRDRAEASRAGTVRLIDALAPKRDCESLVHRQVRKP
jgi:hypothetical protein